MAIKGNPFAAPRKATPRMSAREAERVYLGGIKTSDETDVPPAPESERAEDQRVEEPGTNREQIEAKSGTNWEQTRVEIGNKLGTNREQTGGAAVSPLPTQNGNRERKREQTGNETGNKLRTNRERKQEQTGNKNLYLADLCGLEARNSRSP